MTRNNKRCSSYHDLLPKASFLFLLLFNVGNEATNHLDQILIVVCHVVISFFNLDNKWSLGRVDAGEASIRKEVGLRLRN